jgi:hypothetical protein
MATQQSKKSRHPIEIAKRKLGPLAPALDENGLIPGPRLRAKLGISAVTLWRWRHDKGAGFPTAKIINGRLYFLLNAVSDWLEEIGPLGDLLDN